MSNHKITLKSDTVNRCTKKVVGKLEELPEGAVSLLPTRYMCEQINAEVLKGLPVEGYSIFAEDSVDCSISCLQKVKQQLANHSEDSTHIAGLENVITVKYSSTILRCEIAP